MSKPPQRLRDQELLERCLAHDRAAWARFVERFSRLIYSVVYDTLRRHAGPRSEDLVEELFHATFLALYDGNYRKLRQWNGGCSLASWVRLVTASVVIDHLRRQRPSTSLDTDDPMAPLPEALIDLGRHAHRRLEEVERAARVRRALAALSEADRELLVLLYRDDLKPGVVADRLGVKPGAVYTRKNRAIARLREAWTSLTEGDEP